MKGRPRLVQEGSPIGVPAATTQQRSGSWTQSSSSAAQQRKKSGQQMSSLQQAAMSSPTSAGRRSSFGDKRKSTSRKSSHVIGGNDDTNSRSKPQSTLRSSSLAVPFSEQTALKTSNSRTIIGGNAANNTSANMPASTTSNNHIRTRTNGNHNHNDSSQRSFTIGGGDSNHEMSSHHDDEHNGDEMMIDAEIEQHSNHFTPQQSPAYHQQHQHYQQYQQQHHQQHHQQHTYSQPQPRNAPSASVYVVGQPAQTHATISNDNHHQQAPEPAYDYDIVERMEGVEDHSIKTPLLVLDGANVAYAYATAKLDGPNASSLHHESRISKIQPDTRGIQVATDYFEQTGFRVLVVLPLSWMRSKPRNGDRGNAQMQTPQLELLENLRNKGLLVASPPTDDDDAYALMIARRETQRAAKRPQTEDSAGYVVSNDLFRDAIARDATKSLKTWLSSARISYTFCDMGSTDDYGDRILDFVPNPRHRIVMQAESMHQSVS